MRTVIKDKILHKIKSSRGETITETLVSLVIIVLAMTMLAGSIVAAASVNNKVKNASTAFTAENAVTIGKTNTAVITHGDGTVTDKTVTIYSTNDSNAYIYYEEETTTP